MSNKTSTPYQKLLIVGPAWIGDMIMAQALFKLLRAHNPNLVIDVLAPAWTMSITQRMPEVSTGIAFPFKHGELQLLKRRAFAKQLRAKSYDQAIVLPGSFKSALTPWWTNIPVRTGWIKECRSLLLTDGRILDKTKLPLMVQQYAALGLPKDAVLPNLTDYYPQLSIDEANQQQLLDRFQIDAQRPILVLCPGAEYGPAKRWPTESFAEVARAMQSSDWQILILGSAKDAPIAKAITETLNKPCIDLTGKTSLIDAIDLMALATTVISNDSGLMHMAAALNRDLIVLYGSSSPGFTPPLTARAKIVNLQLPCSPCFKRECPLTHFDCMNKISPSTVLALLKGGG